MQQCGDKHEFQYAQGANHDDESYGIFFKPKGSAGAARDEAAPKANLAAHDSVNHP
jgi:hypothetical protein